MEDITIIILLAIVVWTIISAIVGSFGKSRSIGFTGAFFASFILSPILAMLFVLASEKTAGGKLSSGEKSLFIIPILIVVSIFIGNHIIERKNEIAKARQEIVDIQSLQLSDLKEADYMLVNRPNSYNYDKVTTLYRIPYEINGNFYFDISTDIEVHGIKELEEWKKAKITQLNIIIN
jgi:hypothetical protein